MFREAEAAKPYTFSPLNISYQKGDNQIEKLSIEYKNILELNSKDYLKRKDNYQFNNLRHWLKFYKNSK